MQFTALEDFWSDETQSQYCAGLSYSIDDEVPTRVVTSWIMQGKVEPGRPAAQISGRG